MSRAQLLRPFPQFSGVGSTLNGGFSWYHALSLRAEKRFSHGLTVQGTYTWSKYMEAVDKLNASDPYPHHVVAAGDRPQHLVISGIYELPFGRLKYWGDGWPAWAGHILGGWSVQGVYQGQSGPPLGFGNTAFYGSLHDIVLPRGQRKVERWFNTEAGFERDPRRQLGSNLRTFPMRLTGLRADGFNNLDLSAFKTFRLAEGLRLQLRGEANDALNHALFAGPNTGPVNTLFGTVSATNWNEQRKITVSARLMW